MRNTKKRLYIAYGSNLNLGQMALRCPTAKVIGAARLENRRLLFRGGHIGAVATVERRTDCFVPVLVWELQPRDEAALDRYEGWPHLYRKETARIRLGGKNVLAMLYVMNEGGNPCGLPARGYLDTIREGYKSAGFDLSVLRRAMLDSAAEMRT